MSAALMVHAAAIQLNSQADKEANLADAEKLIREAAREGAQLVVLPELFNGLGEFPQMVAAAEPIPGPTSERMSRLAAELNIFLCAGSICEQSDDPLRGYNTALLFDNRGQLILNYRKIHLFEINHPEQTRLCEPDFILPGDRLAAVHTELGMLGLATCFDLRFPELFRALADRNVELVLFPSAFTRFTGAAHWHTLVRARAIENQCFFIAANQVGQHNPSLRSYGHSLIVDAWGNLLAEANGEHAEIILAELDFAELQATRERIPALKSRRPFE